MPLYLYSHPDTGEIKEISQSMKENHVYEEDGVKWNRVFTVPQGFVSQNIDPFNSNQFVERTGNKKGNIGNLFDESAALSEKRKKQSPDGRDKIQDKWFDEYSKKRSGKVHPADDRPKKKTTLKIKK